MYKIGKIINIKHELYLSENIIKHTGDLIQSSKERLNGISPIQISVCTINFQHLQDIH